MIRINRANQKENVIVPLTPSKSITNRLLIISALSKHRLKVLNAATADDSIILTDILNHLTPLIDAKDSGTAFRFLTAFLCIQPGEFILTGSERMRSRPIGILVKALKELGAEIDFCETENFPPLKINGKKLKGGKVKIDGSVSSQFISALLLIAPLLTGGLEVELCGKINSEPYIEMTLGLMKKFGVQYEREGNCIIIPETDYNSKEVLVESDWSSASFWYEIAALSLKPEILLKNISLVSIQGDFVIDSVMKNFGVISEVKGADIILRRDQNFVLPKYFEYDFTSCPDLVMPVAATCAALRINSRFDGIKNLRIKESDRVQSIKAELEKTGCKISINDNDFTIGSFSQPGNQLHFSSHNDHRMAMSLAPLILKFENIEIDNPITVTKSYPEFWNQFEMAGFDFQII